MKKLNTSFCVLAFSCMIAGAWLLWEDNVGVAASQAENQIVMGGDCYRDGNLPRTVCKAFCGGTLSVQSRSKGETGGCAADDVCQSGYNCNYPSYNAVNCSGG